MSKLGKKPIDLLEGVTFTQEGRNITIKGPKGELSYIISDDFILEISEKDFRVSPKKLTLESNTMWGTTVAHLKNKMQGVFSGFEKRLEVEGVGYRVEVQGQELILNIGYSHSVKLDIPKDLSVRTEKNTVVVAGLDKESVGQFAALVRFQRKPNVYKGNGIRYSDEIIRRKSGKKVASSS